MTGRRNHKICHNLIWDRKISNKPKRIESFDSVSIKQSLLLTKFIDFIKDEFNGDRNKILLLTEYSYHTEIAL